MGTRVIRVDTSDRLLRRALLAHLRQVPDFVLAEPDGITSANGSGELVVSTTTEYPASRVAELVKDGKRVVVLAAVPRGEEKGKYKNAGVSAYIPMTADGGSLLKEIREAVS